MKNVQKANRVSATNYSDLLFDRVCAPLGLRARTDSRAYDHARANQLIVPGCGPCTFSGTYAHHHTTTVLDRGNVE